MDWLRESGPPIASSIHLSQGSALYHLGNFSREPAGESQGRRTCCALSPHLCVSGNTPLTPEGTEG